MSKSQNSTKYILPFAEISQKDIQVAGGKGANLGEMTKNGIKVPSGFVISSLVFKNFLSDANIKNKIEKIIERIDANNPESIKNSSKNIRELILKSKITKNIKERILNVFVELKSEFVSVRSSATTEDSKADSWAGQLETYLNTTEENLIENIKKCWASLYSERALFYGAKKELVNKKNSVAVVVQKMIQSEISGVCFTVHPVNKDVNQMIIEAGFGLGEAIVSGMITPDNYVVDKINIEILSKKINNQKKMVCGVGNKNEIISVDYRKSKLQKLSDSDIIKLSKTCVKIEKHYKEPQDIEWAFKDDKFYILQSRPITTL
ncbi:MAG: hypothetical protein KAU07_03695 [Candidatus Andersenbacteria bacterium]|nr:hypothetical protein [Candidatus Andersenbacteria bacterium]